MEMDQKIDIWNEVAREKEKEETLNLKVTEMSVWNQHSYKTKGKKKNYEKR